jgi:hypothetical protein
MLSDGLSASRPADLDLFFPCHFHAIGVAAGKKFFDVER